MRDPATVETPSHWIKGQLLNVRKYDNGTYVVTQLDDDASHPQSLTFLSTEDCQAFVSWWYAAEVARHG